MPNSNDVAGNEMLWERILSPLVVPGLILTAKGNLNLVAEYLGCDQNVHFPFACLVAGTGGTGVVDSWACLDDHLGAVWIRLEFIAAR
ncbi:hypothetical protein [Bradyrhizobium sp. LB11.1]|uniref:hypothetical protein n=1 Tax=Bradyrhizobium sp. LB11.1 TaxID=3156326 RepID=UPI003399E752